MKKTNKIIVALSMVMIALSITSLCFTIAWYNAYPAFHQISLQTGGESLEIHNRVFSRTRNASTGKNEYTATNNIKTVSGEKNLVTGGQLSDNQGQALVTFDNLSFSLFGITNADVDINPNGGLLDPNTMTWDASYLTFAVMECTFYNQYFPAYLTASYTSTITLNGAAYAGNLFSIKIVHETTELGQNSSMFGNINGDVNNTALQNQNIASVNDNVLFNQNDVNFKTISSGSKTDVLFPNPDPETSGATPNVAELKIEPHGASTTTIAAEGANYSYAFAVALSINPVELFKLVTSETGFAPNQTFSVTTLIEFEASNIGGAK